MVIKGYLNQEQHMELNEILESIKKLIIAYIKKLAEDIEA
ncbi:hypothetical protein [Clostridium sp. DL-VIII]|nr:hypothetical protein [Clostridium sp. DL-VIII]